MKSLIESTLIAASLALLIFGIIWFVENFPVLLAGGTLGVMSFGFVILVKDYLVLDS